MVKIIGAGLCRTGTTSTVVALDSLGLGPVYHYNEVCFTGLLCKIEASTFIADKNFSGSLKNTW